MKLTRPLVVLDLETTGTWIEKDRIVEIAMVRCASEGPGETYAARVNPGMPIPPRVSQIIGITDADVRNAPPFTTIAEEVVRFIGDADLAGFNVERFDLPLLERALYEAGIRWAWRDRTIYDAQKIYHLHEKRTLTAAYQFYCGKALVNAHTALGDVQATIEILAGQIAKYGAPDEGLVSLRGLAYEQMDDYFDAGKKFRWWNGELYPIFGKYARKCSLKDIAQKEPSYLQWLLTTDFPENVKAMLSGVLHGQFPTAGVTK